MVEEKKEEHLAFKIVLAVGVARGTERERKKESEKRVEEGEGWKEKKKKSAKGKARNRRTVNDGGKRERERGGWINGKRVYEERVKEARRKIQRKRVGG